MRFSADALLEVLRRHECPRRYLVALSGGLDSTVLLHALHALRDQLGAPLAAIHVDHGLAPQSASWAERCRSFCESRNIPLSFSNLHLAPPPGASIERFAREKRYLAIERAMRDGDAVLTAHHRDDQAETFLLLLLRGSGPAGLAAMPPVRSFGKGVLMRPLLDFARADLEVYAHAAGLKWSEDRSNLDTRFDRNYLRHEVLPLLRRRWPSATQTIARSASLCAEASMAVETLAAGDVEIASRGDCLSVASLRTLPSARLRAAIRLWLARRRLPVPDRRRLQELERQIDTARHDSVPLVAWPGAEVRRWRGRLYAGAPLPAAPPCDAVLKWPAGNALELPGGLGRMMLSPRYPPSEPEVRFRRGGEQCTIRGVRRDLKQVFQDAGVPPWLRNRVPLVYLGGELAALGDSVFADCWPEGLRLCWDKVRGVAY